MADPDEALTGRESSAASAEASPALIEAIAEAIRGSNERWLSSDPTTLYARAAWAAMVAHLGLVEERRYVEPIQPHPEPTPTERRLVQSRWTEVDHGSE